MRAPLRLNFLWAILLCCLLHNDALCLGKQQTIVKEEVHVSTPYGSFDFKNVSVSSDGTISGTVINSTTKSWRHVQFSYYLKDKKGRFLPNCVLLPENWTTGVNSLSKGQAGQLGEDGVGKGWRNVGETFTDFEIRFNAENSTIDLRDDHDLVCSRAEASGSFNDQVNSLGPHFRGHDPEAISKALEALEKTNAKSEFETTAEFEQRKKKAMASQPIPCELVFVVPPATENLSGFRATYDADGQAMAVSLQFMPRTFVLEPDKPDFNLLDLSHKGSTARYVGQNAYGATAEVSSYQGEAYGLAMPTNAWVSEVQSGTPTYRILLPMGTDYARNLKPNLGVLVVCSLRQSKRLTWVSGHEATIDSPTEGYITTTYLNAKIEQVWVYDSQSGEVIKKVTAR
jgi:hypothetical protein